MQRRMVNGFHVGLWKHEARRTQERFGKSERAFLDLIALAESLPTKLGDIRRSRDLTDAGKRKAVRDLVQKEAVPQLKSAADTVRASDTYAAEKRAGMAYPRADKTDLVGALVRQELRTMFRSLAPAERVAKMAMSENIDPTTALALLEAPPELSGITREQHGRLQDRAVLAANPELGKELLDLEDASASIASAARAVSLTIKKEAGIAATELGEMMGGPTFKQRLEQLIASAAGDLPADAA